MNKKMIAPCGMNCSLCMAHFREKNKCLGCRMNNPNITHTQTCSIKNCECLKETKSNFCYECKKYPCLKIKRLDKRYKEKYRMSMIDNLNNIESNGLEKFLASELKKWTCKKCGTIICVHKDTCLNCNSKY
jgi:hypothetical protein